MTAVETICRAMAKVVCRSKGQNWNDDREQWFIENHWQEHEQDAKRLLRALKDQPPHVTDAGPLNDMLEAMTR